MNRKIFSFNQEADRVLIKPVSRGYVTVLPSRLREGIHNFLRNLNEPLVLGNDLLQLGFRKAAKTAGRFFINSTAGVFGLIDVASGAGLPKQTGDFGQTLYTWGAPEGPYLVLPLLGPSSPRDAIGRGVDIFLDPYRYVASANGFPTYLSTGKFITEGVDERARNLDTLDELQRESLDFYASLRSLYRQNRYAELHGGAPPPPAPADDIYSDPGQP